MQYYTKIAGGGLCDFLKKHPSRIQVITPTTTQNYNTKPTTKIIHTISSCLIPPFPEDTLPTPKKSISHKKRNHVRLPRVIHCTPSHQPFLGHVDLNAMKVNVKEDPPSSR